jgi:hypothetical protein
MLFNGWESATRRGELRRDEDGSLAVVEGARVLLRLAGEATDASLDRKLVAERVKDAGKSREMRMREGAGRSCWS